MIVQRLTVKVKPGNRDAMVEMLKAARAEMENPRRMRILKPGIGVPLTTIEYELLNESVEENQKDWDEWFTKPGSQALLERWEQLVEDQIDVFYTIED
jgi:hypothetical protein